MDDALQALLGRHRPRTILVLGASDTGKTTLIEQLLADWHPGEAVAVVDCDVGQSHVGPPTTIGWGLIEGSFRGWHQVTVRDMAFTGSVSPEGNLEMFLGAVSHIVQAARQVATYLVVDTTGLITGELGNTIKARKIELIKPDLILAIQQEQELEELLASLPPGPVERVPASAACIRRSLAQRAAYRDRQFARYFANSTKQTFSLPHMTLIGLGPDWPQTRVIPSPSALMDRVVSLRNRRGEDRALGLVREVNLDANTLTIFTPLRDVSAITTIAVGSIRWPVQDVTRNQ